MSPPPDMGFHGWKINISRTKVPAAWVGRPRGEEMQQAIPVAEYNADERAERARGAVIAFLIVAAAAIAVPALLIAIWFF